ncbi:SDR family oxidoreductase [Sphingomonas sp.]|uniref:SDR family oxidoreductase n=1 Tax=Sphingomonas sp. TaxID=28214 RepID=UPI002EDA0D9C
MRILLLGAGGFIGRHILSELLASGHGVRAVARDVASLREMEPGAEWVGLDLSRATEAQSWAPHLAGIDCVVNAAGVLRGPEMHAVHVAMPRALHAACRKAEVRRVILISAVSARPEVATDYARTKLEGEAALRDSGLRWTILRPSLVIAEGSYGGTSLLRGLSALPLFQPLAGDGDFPFSPIHADDLARSVRLACENQWLVNMTLEPAGPETLALRALMARYRNWLGFGRARFVSMPMAVMRVFGRIGDLAGSGPVSTNSLTQMVAGNAADGTAFAQAVGFRPRSLDNAMRDRAAGVQDRWHARLFFLAPAIRWGLALMWLVSALLGLFAGRAQTLEVLAATGAPETAALPLQIGTALLDLGIAALVLCDTRARTATIAQLVVVMGYTLALTIALPALWTDPLGPLLKNLPVLLLILVHGAIGDRRG